MRQLPRRLDRVPDVACRAEHPRGVVVQSGNGRDDRRRLFGQNERGGGHRAAEVDFQSMRARHGVIFKHGARNGLAVMMRGLAVKRHRHLA